MTAAGKKTMSYAVVFITLLVEILALPIAKRGTSDQELDAFLELRSSADVTVKVMVSLIAIEYTCVHVEMLVYIVMQLYKHYVIA